ncbi:hypothetical protein AVEN_237046-1 [Araneus ventricosus]|uniref:Uncharacterized protein n=1 Tax=Araneus ventricosus TaxID=182803 RepID=A0A4Y2LZI6_ARAVE|nr:hypothetical protein AVEN_237046-1 [Araneus ventricosus]
MSDKAWVAPLLYSPRLKRRDDTDKQCWSSEEIRKHCWVVHDWDRFYDGMKMLFRAIWGQLTNGGQNRSGSEGCFLTATTGHRPTNPDGSALRQRSRATQSHTTMPTREERAFICHGAAKIQFFPSGVLDQFSPYLQFGEGASYKEWSPNGHDP